MQQLPQNKVLSNIEVNRVTLSLWLARIGSIISLGWVGLALYLNAEIMLAAASLAFVGSIAGLIFHGLTFSLLAGLCFLVGANLALLIGAVVVHPSGLLAVMYLGLAGIPFLIFSWERGRLLIILLSILPPVLWITLWIVRLSVFGEYEVGLDRTRFVAIGSILTTYVFVIFEFAFFSYTVNKSQQQLGLALDLANQASHAKSAFLANMSHEIRTPMNGVIAMSEVLSYSDLGPSEREMVRVIQQSADHLLAIINDILDFSKIEAGKLSLLPEPMSIEKVVNTVCRLLDRVASEKKIELTLYTDPDLPLYVECDPVRLQQILMNLLGNAIKFSAGLDRQGKVLISAELDHLSGDFAKIVFTVRDNGIGMDANTLQRVFQPFEQADLTTTKRFGGTGLGLEITRQLVGLMSGDIEVESALDKGTTFRIHMNFAVLSKTLDESSLLLEGVDCIIAGGDEYLKAILVDYLDHEGASVWTVANFDEGCRFVERGAVKAKHVCLLVVDELSKNPFPNIMNRLNNMTVEQNTPVVDISYMSIEHGKRRQPRRLSDRIVQLDREVMTRKTVLQAVAMAVGRMSSLDMIEAEDICSRLKKVAPDRDSALQHGRLILVVEDNEANKTVILSQLALLGYAADAASNGEEGYEKWLETRYALVLTDLHMPNVDGYELTSLIRRRESEMECSHTPIVALTANALKTEEEHCFSVGMDGYLSKPVKLDWLERTVSRWVAVESSEESMDDSDAAVFVDVHSTSAGTVEERPVDPNFMIELLGKEDKKIFGNIMRAFLENAEPDVKGLSNALYVEDMMSVNSLAHKLKSSSKSIGAIAFSRLCLEVETGAKNGTLSRTKVIARDLEKKFEDIREFVNEYTGGA